MYHFQEIKENYFELFDDKTSIKDKKVSARLIVENILKNNYFKDFHIRNQYQDYYFKRYKKEFNKSFDISFSKMLDFLIEIEKIPKELKSNYSFIWNECSRELHTKESPLDTKFNNQIINIIRILINEILFHFLKVNYQENYIIPIKSYTNKDNKILNQLLNRIDNVWDIENQKSFLFKYKTVIIYIISIILIPLFNFLSIILITILILRTQKFVFNEQIRFKRNLFHYPVIIISVAVLLFNFFTKSEFSKEKGYFDNNTFPKLNSTLAVYNMNDSLPAKNLDFIDLKKENYRDIVIRHDFKNNGDLNIISGFAYLRIIRNKDNIIFEGSLINGEQEIIDSVLVLNITKPYYIEYVNGIIRNSHEDDCNSYGYEEILHENMYLNTSKSPLENGKINKGVYLGLIDAYKDGKCSKGSIFSKFRITKL